ncbi:DUF4192 domain-containing protein [Amycolatopsis sp. PS_44_ISF1]|uniref:DUF4192 domain-containing protein n=1 Tax=Amycolatopsis sp. PS_44_ISF1 TaxID=2974917 RepID=UPI0028E03580|nr:DUF4192 domain-containing protein [Amycolatopsis sp. PS_44_ISF1]MDT8914250.1 DUF4192 domain-containing protein [Amycolatopsis sp. PS_44_ISF1]
MTTSTPPGSARPVLTDPAQLIAALPYLLGFTPTDSLVLLGHRPPGTGIGLVLRADLPPQDLFAYQADALAPRFRAAAHIGVTAVVVGGHAGPDGRPPFAAFVTQLQRALAEQDLRLLHPLWTAAIEEDAPWSCYRDEECGGLLPDPRGTVIAAATTRAGLVSFPSREHVAALLEPRSPEAIVRRTALLGRLEGPPGATEDLVSAATAEVRAAFERRRSGVEYIDDEQAVRLAHALTIKPVRDACLALASPPGTEVALDAEALWLSLVQELPPPHRAEPASLLAYTALLRGEGALAGMALENALEASPGHLVARLLYAAWNRGIDPARLGGLGARSEVDLGLEDAGAG